MIKQGFKSQSHWFGNFGVQFSYIVVDDGRHFEA